MDIIPRCKLCSEEWDSLVNSSPDGWVFSLWGWQELIETVEPWALEDHGFAFREGRRLLVVVPLHYHPGSGRMASTGWGGSGPVIDGRIRGKARERLMGQAVQRCLDLAKARGAVGFDVSLSPVTATSISSVWGVNPLVFHSLKDHSGLSQVVDLSVSEDELWADLTSDARRQIKQARDAGFRVERVDWSQHLDRYYELHVATYTRTGVQPHPRAYFAGIAAHTAPTGNSVLWALCAPGGEYIAYHNAAWFGSGSYYHTGCSADSALHAGANHLLFWEAMLGAMHAGIRWYDCGSIFPDVDASEKQRGLSTFKTKIGGQPHRQFGAGVNFLQHGTTPTAVPPEPTFPRRLLRGLMRRLCAYGHGAS